MIKGREGVAMDMQAVIRTIPVEGIILQLLDEELDHPDLIQGVKGSKEGDTLGGQLKDPEFHIRFFIKGLWGWFHEEGGVVTDNQGNLKHQELQEYHQRG